MYEFHMVILYAKCQAQRWEQTKMDQGQENPNLRSNNT